MKSKMFFGTLAFGAVTLGLGFYKLVWPPIDGEGWQVQKGQTISILNVVGDAVGNWVKEEKRSPSSEESFAVLGMKKNRPLDGWDRPLKYEKVGPAASPHFLLYSVGENGIDERGSGDDIVYSKSQE